MELLFGERADIKFVAKRIEIAQLMSAQQRSPKANEPRADPLFSHVVQAA